jgi:hypothetical protein
MRGTEGSEAKVSGIHSRLMFWAAFLFSAPDALRMKGRGIREQKES